MINKTIYSIVPKKLAGRIQRLKKQGSNFSSLAKNYGQWSSIKDWNSVDENGHPIPWYTYPATEYLSYIDWSNFNVFEYGSGNSTLWWSDRVNHISSVEDDEFWHEKIKFLLWNKSNISYFLEKDERKYFCKATECDIYIIDGKFRRKCLEHVTNLVGGGCLLILDNSDWYPKSVNFLRTNLGWIQIDFHGFGPINGYTWTTSIFVNPARHTELIYSNSLKSKCGLVQVADDDY